MIPMPNSYLINVLAMKINHRTARIYDGMLHIYFQ